MAVERRLGVAEIIRGWEEGQLIRGEVPYRLMKIINSGNVDEVIASLTPDVREIFVDFAREHYTGGELISMEKPEIRQEPTSSEALTAVRGWLQRH